ncbi:galactose mutarotase-like enzyme [Arthrobacter pigmenti]|uniref:Galactose mutarotase-like enzyme n=1 Tax=Arthrobacter pigmenti TaxID=271432 RepID=A0A846RY46_9MICC|nr:galactose mutarotase-like enzyme [Arthrobacter pigmenti]
MSARELASYGLFASLRPRASVKESIGIPGTPAAERLLTARLFDSFEFEVLPGRGFDIGDTWHRGIPISWFSPVSDSRALPSPSGVEWLTRFTGGLLTTCGFGTIGAEGSGEGMHGRANHLPADQVSWHVAEEGSVSIDALIESVAVFGPSFSVRRSYRAASDVDGMSRLTVTDEVTNIGPEAAPLSMLYHLNFGAPVVAPGSQVIVASEEVRAATPHPDVPDWSVLPKPADHITEAVFEHRRVRQTSDGLARATILSSVADLAVVVDWSATTLPRLHQWMFPTRGRWALGIEPATAPLFGPDRANKNAGAPVLAPGQSRSHEVRISVGSREAALA